MKVEEIKWVRINPRYVQNWGVRERVYSHCSNIKMGSYISERTSNRATPSLRSDKFSGAAADRVRNVPKNSTIACCRAALSLAMFLIVRLAMWDFDLCKALASVIDCALQISEEIVFYDFLYCSN